MRRWGLTATFAVVSLLAMVVVGVALTVVIGRQVRQSALDEALRTGQAFVTAGLMDVAGAESLTNRQPALTDEQRQLIRELADTDDAFGDQLRGVRLWSSDSVLVFATDDQTDHPDGIRLDAAVLRNEATAEVLDGPGGTPLLSVYVPIRGESGIPLGAAEIVLDHSSTEAALANSMRLVALVVVGGLGLLWLLLFRTVSNASRRLRGHATENARLALLDPLTGLPNRRLLAERIDRAVVAAGRSEHSIALLLLDVDGFKDINDTLGHDVGDQLLMEVGSRVRAIARESDTVARLGGDEFAILMPVVRGADEASALARRVLGAFGDAFILDGMTLHVDSSVGVALLPEHADDQMTLMRHADVAMYAAKRAKIGYAVYSREGDHHTAQRLTLLSDLRLALAEHDQLALHYQPKIDLRTGRVAGLEALLRWTHPENGLVSPAEFIPLAEQTGMISDLSHWVLDRAIAQLGAWERDRAPVPLDLAVNLSARNLHEVELSERVRHLLQGSRVSPASLEVEITESAMPGDAGMAQDAMHALADLGVRLAVDDFGIGNTSISQLRNIPLRTVKIDRSFIAPLTTDPGSIVLVRAIVELAHEFGLLTVAEGVEDAETAMVLRDLQCDLAQGFLWSPAVPAGDVVAVITRIDAAAEAAAAVTSGSARTGRRPRSR